MRGANSGEGVGCFVVSLANMMKFETFEMATESAHHGVVCLHGGVLGIPRLHGLLHQQIRVSATQESTDAE